jgi:uncharacterized protein (TIGR03435 family)
LLLSLPCLLPDAALAQESGHFKFDIASVKLAVRDDDAPSLISGGPGTSDPELITYQRQLMLRLLFVAYGVDVDQISGPPSLGTDLYSIVARIPPGTTPDQLRLMWQDLLVERFHLKMHFIQKDFPVYELSVGNGGPKFHVAAGFPVPRPGEKWAFQQPFPRDIQLAFRDCSMADFAHRLGWPLSTLGASGGLALGRVLDKTGLDGLYNFTLEFAGAWGPGGAFLPPLPDQPYAAPSLFDALRRQLNLKLEEKKALLDVLVVDHLDRVPTEN